MSLSFKYTPFNSDFVCAPAFEFICWAQFAIKKDIFRALGTPTMNAGTFQEEQGALGGAGALAPGTRLRLSRRDAGRGSQPGPGSREDAMASHTAGHTGAELASRGQGVA